MTKREKIIVSAYTGFLMCDFSDVHEYIQKKFGRPVFTHELADKGIQKAVKEMSKEEFLEICNREEPERKNGKWIFKKSMMYCSECCDGFEVGNYHYFKFCPNCGADMRGVIK